jgi:adenine-specific DNA-methyltransferase
LVQEIGQNPPSTVQVGSNKWYRINYGKGLRNWLSTHARILKIVDFGDAPVFESIAYPTILIGTRKVAPGRPSSNEIVLALNWTADDDQDTKESVKRFPARFAAESFEIPQAELADSSDWQFIPRSSGKILARLRSNRLAVRDFTIDTVYRGITTGIMKPLRSMR